ncbi:MAG: iron donor protein CyaY [Bryobacteraceae bacterium]|nr:iron donor protein CyaY [Bryobacteraceae bacterium]
MALDDGEFRLKSDEALERLHDALVRASEMHGFESDFGGALTVEFEDPPTKFVVSPNAPVKQIWISAHLKSYKLEWDAARESFILPETGQTLSEVVSSAVSRRLGQTVTLNA